MKTQLYILLNQKAKQNVAKKNGQHYRRLLSYVKTTANRKLHAIVGVIYHVGYLRFHSLLSLSQKSVSTKFD